MNVLFLCNTKNIGNPFVTTLINGLNELGVNAFDGINNFWSSNNFDILHIQWPEAIWEWKSISDDDVSKFKQRILFLKEKNIKIVYTKHNNSPHNLSAPIWNYLYNFIERSADVVCHLGPESFSNNNNNNIIIEHHIYDKLYKIIDKKSARQKLNIPSDSFVILAFGSVRNKIEKKLLLDNFKKINIKRKLLLAPSLINSEKKFPGDKLIRFFLKYLYRYKKVIIDLKSIPEDLLPYYFCSADIAIIQRVKILNSGNLPMAYYFKLPVIGPNIGNVGYILTRTNNFIFEPSKTSEIAMAIESIYRNPQIKEIGNRNYDIAIKQWRTSIICQKYKNAYQTLLQNN